DAELLHLDLVRSVTTARRRRTTAQLEGAIAVVNEGPGRPHHLAIGASAARGDEVARAWRGIEALHRHLSRDAVLTPRSLREQHQEPPGEHRANPSASRPTIHAGGHFHRLVAQNRFLPGATTLLPIWARGSHGAHSPGNVYSGQIRTFRWVWETAGAPPTRRMLSRSPGAPERLPLTAFPRACQRASPKRPARMRVHAKSSILSGREHRRSGRDAGPHPARAGVRSATATARARGSAARSCRTATTGANSASANSASRRDSATTDAAAPSHRSTGAEPTSA